MRVYKLTLLYIAFIAVSETDGQNSGISCYEGWSGTTTQKSGCQFCQTTTTWVNGTVLTSYYACSSSCASSNITSGGSTVVTSCCNYNNCNYNAMNTGVKCYDIDGSIKDGCKYCQKIISTFPVQTVLSRMCTSICIATDTGIAKTTCCQTDMCNHAVVILPTTTTLLFLVINYIFNSY